MSSPTYREEIDIEHLGLLYMLFFLRVVSINASIELERQIRTPVVAARLSIRKAVAKVDKMPVVLPLPTAHLARSSLTFSITNWEQS
jgi:hypothetical protein